jgi:exodeoxyribonuclease VII small subunit
VTEDHDRSGEATEEPGLEARLRRLEEIVSALEGDELELEKALELFEEGVTHVRRAELILARVELRVEELLGGGETRPFQAGEE